MCPGCNKHLEVEVVRAEWIDPVKSRHMHNEDGPSILLHWTQHDDYAEYVNAPDEEKLARDRIKGLENKIARLKNDLADLKKLEEELEEKWEDARSRHMQEQLMGGREVEELVAAMRELERCGADMGECRLRRAKCEKELLEADAARLAETAKAERAARVALQVGPIHDDSVYRDFVGGSIVPGVFAGTLTPARKILRLTFKTRKSENCKASEPVTITGNIGGLKVKCVTNTFDTTEGALNSCEFGVEKNQSPSFARYASEGVPWKIVLRTCPNPVSVLGSTRHELFLIYAHPSSCWANAHVRIETLRMAWLGAGKKRKSGSSAEKKQLLKGIATYLFSRSTVSYDTLNGTFSYLNQYTGKFYPYHYAVVSRANKKVNCYDQAAAFVATAGAVGIAADVKHIDPFGYINNTTLVGAIRTNNPFYIRVPGSSIEVKYYSHVSKYFSAFNDSGIHYPAGYYDAIEEVTPLGTVASSTAKATYIPMHLIDTTKAHYEYTYFARHEVGVAQIDHGLYYDACAGPHTGESQKGYLTKAVNFEANKKHNMHPYPTSNLPEEASSFTVLNRPHPCV